MRFAIGLAVLIAITVAIVSTGGVLIVLLILIAGSAGLSHGGQEGRANHDLCRHEKSRSAWGSSGKRRTLPLAVHALRADA